MRNLQAALTAINDFISKPGLRWWDKVEFYNAKCEELVLDGELLIEAIERALKAEAENAALKLSLTWAIGQIYDEELESKHICGYHVRPDLGYCDWCDNYGKAFELSDWIEDEECER